MPPRILMPNIQAKDPCRANAPIAREEIAARRSDGPGAMRLLAASCTLALGLALAPSVMAAGLGRLSVHSDLGQPLNAEVEVPAVTRDEAPSLQVRLASQAAFKQANLDFSPSLTQLRFELETRTGGNYAVRITCLLYTSDAADE